MSRGPAREKAEGRTRKENLMRTSNIEHRNGTSRQAVGAPKRGIEDDEQRSRDESPESRAGRSEDGWHDDDDDDDEADDERMKLIRTRYYLTLTRVNSR